MSVVMSKYMVVFEHVFDMKLRFIYHVTYKLQFLS
jgi:hypothetical protein